MKRLAKHATYTNNSQTKAVYSRYYLSRFDKNYLQPMMLCYSFVRLNLYIYLSFKIKLYIKLFEYKKQYLNRY